MEDKELDYTETKNEEKPKKEEKKYNVIACNCCHATTLPLIKATDSYYCKFCFEKLKKQKFQKKRRK